MGMHKLSLGGDTRCIVDELETSPLHFASRLVVGTLNSMRNALHRPTTAHSSTGNMNQSMQQLLIGRRDTIVCSYTRQGDYPGTVNVLDQTHVPSISRITIVRN